MNMVPEAQLVESIVERLAAGMLPACVEACPTASGIFVEDREVNRNKQRKAAAQKK